MSTKDEISAAHDEVVRSRAQMADTVARLEARVTGQMETVKAKLDVVQMIKDNPWTSIAVATGIGVAISASGSDTKAVAATAAAANAAAEKARQAATAAKEAAKAAPAQAKSAAQSARSGLTGHLDEIAASLVTGLIDRLKGQQS